MIHTQSQRDEIADDKSTSSNLSSQESFGSNADTEDVTFSSPEHDGLLAHAAKQSLSPGDLRRVLSTPSSTKG